VSALYLGATMLGFAHLLEQQHAVCVEHGELHHVSSETSDVQLSSADEPQVSRHGWAEDEHCELLHFFQNNSVTIGATAAIHFVGADADLVPTVRPVDLPLGGNERWRFAPKQSPPLSV
jgi:hypothetical protein